MIARASFRLLVPELDIEPSVYGYALHQAVDNGDFLFVRMLLEEKNVDINYADEVSYLVCVCLFAMICFLIC